MVDGETEYTGTLETRYTCYDMNGRHRNDEAGENGVMRYGQTQGNEMGDVRLTGAELDTPLSKWY